VILKIPPTSGMRVAIGLLALLWTLPCAARSEASKNAEVQPLASRPKLEVMKRAAITEQQTASRLFVGVSSMPDSFVIPSDTCQHGKPLLEIKR